MSASKHEAEVGPRAVSRESGTSGARGGICADPLYNQLLADYRGRISPSTTAASQAARCGLRRTVACADQMMMIMHAPSVGAVGQRTFYIGDVGRDRHAKGDELRLVCAEVGILEEDRERIVPHRTCARRGTRTHQRPYRPRQAPAQPGHCLR
eukprot:COSAG06_NODE_1261_length_10074_cov_21.232882_12_plen_153_part_00